MNNSNNPTTVGKGAVMADKNDHRTDNRNSTDQTAKKSKGVIGRVLGEVGEMVGTGVSVATFMALFKKGASFLIENKEFREAASNYAVKTLKGGRGREDELLCYASLIGVSGIDEDAKILFMDKHFEMLNPDLAGKTPAELDRLKMLRERAKGLVFLIATDNENAKSPKKAERFILANEIWHGIFLGINNPLICPDRAAKMNLLEKRIIHYGKNEQEGTTLIEAVQPAKKLFTGLFNPASVDAAKENLRLAKIERRRK